MPMYRSKQRTVEAVRWEKHGDHPAVQELPDDRGIAPRGYGWLPAQQYGGTVVHRGDWIVTSDAWVCRMSPAEFEAAFELVKE
jgi:hypothetical protein